MFFEGDFTVTHSSCTLVSPTYTIERRDSRTTDLVGHHNIVNPHGLRPERNAIQTAVSATTDSHVVNLAILAGIDGEVEGR